MLKKFFLLLIILAIPFFLGCKERVWYIPQEVWVDVWVTGYTGEQGYDETTKTFFGTTPTWGTCAVDPKYFPIGSVFYVPKYAEMCGRYAIALDIGSGVKGYHLDLWTEKNFQAYSLTGYHKVRVLRYGWTNWLVNPKDWGF